MDESSEEWADLMNSSLTTALQVTYQAFRLGRRRFDQADRFYPVVLTRQTPFLTKKTVFQ